MGLDGANVPALASVIVCRSEPATLSSVLVTAKVEAWARLAPSSSSNNVAIITTTQKGRANKALPFCYPHRPLGEIGLPQQHLSSLFLLVVETRGAEERTRPL